MAASVGIAQNLRILQRQQYLTAQLSRLSCNKRYYHSYEHESAPPFTPTESSILSAGLKHVPSQGFTTGALTSGACDVGYRDVSVNLFPAGAFALVQYHLVTQRLALSESEQLGADHDPGVTVKIKELALARLLANKPIIHRWQEVIEITSFVNRPLTSSRRSLLWPCHLIFLLL